MFENAISPSKWILNYKFKSQTDSLTKKEKELEAACKEIEDYVTKEKPRRHGKGKIERFGYYSNIQFSE